jgi:hypothetical protein
LAISPTCLKVSRGLTPLEMPKRSVMSFLSLRQP